MKEGGIRRALLWLFTVLGFCVAVLSALETRVEQVARLCGYFGGGCLDTAAYTLLGIPVSYLGVGYYVFLAAVLALAPSYTFWAVMMGFGVEMAFAWILWVEKLVCFFCFVNLGVMVVLFALAFRPDRIWQTLGLCLSLFLAFYSMLTFENPLTPPSLPPPEASEIVAKVGETPVSAKDVEGPVATRIYSLRRQIYKLKRDQLDQFLDKVVLHKEAQKQDKTVREFLDGLVAQREEVTQEEVESYYERQKKRWEGQEKTREEILESIRGYLEGLKAEEAVREHLRALRDDYRVEILLEEPPLPFTRVALGESPVMGPEDAPVTVVEFSDYLCPACRAAHPIAQEIKKMYEGRIRWVFKDYPLERHRGAKELAVAARCADEQGTFWQYQDKLFNAPRKPDLDQLRSFARELGMDVEAFTRCVEQEETLPLVEEDVRQAREAGVAATPTFVVNGRLKPGAGSVETFKKLVDEALEAARSQ